MHISVWSSDVCSSDLVGEHVAVHPVDELAQLGLGEARVLAGRAHRGTQLVGSAGTWADDSHLLLANTHDYPLMDCYTTIIALRPESARGMVGISTISSSGIAAAAKWSRFRPCS